MPTENRGCNSGQVVLQKWSRVTAKVVNTPLQKWSSGTAKVVIAWIYKY